MIDEEHLQTAREEGERLARAFKSGEKGAYQAIYDRYSDRVGAICRRMLGNPHDAQEATQESLLRIYQGLPRFNGRYQLGAWIARITTNVCLDQLRSRGRHPDDPVDLDELTHDLSTELVDEPEHVMIRRAETRRVRKVLDSLPPLHRAAIVLRDFEGMTYAEIAETMALTECQVKALLFRARKGFKRSWSPLAGLLFPTRLLPLEKIETPRPDEAVRVARAAQPVAEAATSLSQAAASCSVVLQQCGQFVGERFAAVATGVVVGVAAVGGAGVVAKPPSLVPSPERTPQAANPLLLSSQDHDGSEVKAARRMVKETTTAPSGSGDAPETEPTPSPSPTPTPTPTPASGGSDSGSQSGSSPPGSPKTAPTQEPFTIAMGFERAGSIPASKPQATAATVNCDTTEVVQELRAPFWDGAVSYPARLNLTVGSTASIALRFTKDGNEYSYNGGAPSITSLRSGDKLELSFSGSYSWNGATHPSTGNLPLYGRFSARLTLDCTAPRVVTESIRFSTE